MGNSTSGFGVLNLSTWDINIGLSMGGTHYYENRVGHGKIFYRWPGAVHYTVYAQVNPEITHETCVSEITGAISTGATIGSSILLLALAGKASGKTRAAISSVSSTLLPLAAGVSGKKDSGAPLNLAINAIPQWFNSELGARNVDVAKASQNAAAEARTVLENVRNVDLYTEMKGCYGGGSGTWLILYGGLLNDDGQVRHEKLRLEISTAEKVASLGSFTNYSYDQFYTTDEARDLRTTDHSCSKNNCPIAN